MVKILKVDLDNDNQTMQDVASFLPFLFSKYSGENFVTYIVAISEKEKAYVFRQNEHCMFYIPSKKEVIPFDVDEKGALTTIFYKD